MVELDKSDWFEKTVEPEEITPLFQNIQAPTNNGSDKKIFSWKYSLDIKLYMVKRRGGEIMYISNRKHFKAFPRWNLRTLAEIPLINADQSDCAKFLETEIHAGINDNFEAFGFMKPERKRSKNDLDWATGKRKIVMRLKPIKMVTRVRVPDPSPSRLQDFEKWFYDNQTGEAVVRMKTGAEIRLFDPMEVFSFSIDDLKVLCENLIKCGAGAETKNEAALFERVANRARGIRSGVKQLAESVQHKEDLDVEVRELTHLFAAASAGADPEDPAGEYHPRGSIDDQD